MPAGQIIVSKVFVGHSVPIREGEPVDKSNYPKAYSVYCNVDTKQRSAMIEGTKSDVMKKNIFQLVFVQSLCLYVCFLFRETTLVQNTHWPWVQSQTKTVVHVWPWACPTWVHHIFWIHHQGKFFIFFYFVYCMQAALKTSTIHLNLASNMSQILVAKNVSFMLSFD